VRTIGKRLALFLVSTPCGNGYSVLSCLPPFHVYMPRVSKRPGRPISIQLLTYNVPTISITQKDRKGHLRMNLHPHDYLGHSFDRWMECISVG